MPLGIVIGQDTLPFRRGSLKLANRFTLQHGGQKLSSFGYEGKL